MLLYFGVSEADVHAFLSNYPIQDYNSRSTAALVIDKQTKGEGKTGVPGEKPLGARTRTNNKLNPRLTPSPGIEPGPHWWETCVGGEFSTTAPSLQLSLLVSSHSSMASKSFFSFGSISPELVPVTVI